MVPKSESGGCTPVVNSPTTLVAVLRSEEDPAQCHRHHLIARYILANHPEIDVRHIRGDGTVFGAGTILKSVDAPTVTQHSLF